MKKINYDLVDVQRYDGIDIHDGGSHVWTYLGCYIVKKDNNGKGICFENDNLEYDYLPYIGGKGYDYTDVNVGDIRIVPKSINPFVWSSATAGIEFLRQFIENSDLPFVDDDMYATKRETIKQKIMRMGNK